ncbi:MAG: IPT/TIG domain-containing protein [Planctomycetes bacterium]|nr:IPT/TIG domain-containing protein [Planctomycetota bacterium]
MTRHTRTPLTLPLFSALALGLTACGGGAGGGRSSTTSPVTSNTPGANTSLGLASLSPTVGGEAGGVEVTLFGAGFPSNLVVDFDGLPAADVVVVSSDTVVCKTPAHAPATVDVTVRANAQQVSLTAAFTFQPSPGLARTGALDPTFNGTGVFVRDEVGVSTSSYDYLYGVTTDALGRVIAVGESNLGRTGSTNRDAVVLRLNPDGTLDPTFGVGGRVTHAGAAGGVDDWDKAEAVALDAQGRIVVTGRSYTLGSPGNADLVVWRYLDDGSLDPTFNTVGFATHGNAAGGDGWDNGQALAIDAQGRIVVAGFSSVPLQAGQSLRDRKVTVWRFLPDGTLDPAFGTGGFNVVASGTDDEAWGVAIDAQGRIVVTGQVGNGAAQDMGVWRFLDDGSLDPAFGAVGQSTFDNAAGGQGIDTGYALALDAQGRILVAGRSFAAAGSSDMAVWRITDAGVLDPTFGGAGVAVLTDPGGVIGAPDTAYGIAVDPANGRIVVVGNGTGIALNDATVWQLLPDGTSDPAFGAAGVVQHNNAAGGNASDQARAVAIDAQGKVLVVGSSSQATNNTDFAIWRFQ